MRELVRITLVQWHLFEAEDIEIAGPTGIIGANRSGKSTLVDLISTVISGAGRDILKLNASANDQTHRRGGRTVQAYCLGRLGDGEETLRSEARTYIALTFRERTAGRAVTIGLALEARRSESQEHVLARFVLDGVEVTTGDFLASDESGDSVPRPWEEVRPLLERRAREAGAALLNHRDSARDYVREYMRILFTGGRFGNERQFLRSFVNAAAFEHIRTATEFARRYLLEEQPIPVRSLRESIETYREVRKTIDELMKKLVALKEVAAAADRFAAALRARDEARWLAIRAAFLHAREAWRHKLAQRGAAERAHAAAEARIADIDGLIGELDSDRRRLEEALAATGVTAKRQRLLDDRRQLAAEREQVGKRLAAKQQATRRLADLLRQPRLLPDDKELRAVLEQLDATSREGTAPAWPADPPAFEEAIEALRPSIERLHERLEAKRDAIVTALGAKQRDVAELQGKRARLAEGLAAIGGPTQRMVERLRREGMRPRVVCEFLEMRDETWRDAAEALLGRDREAIIVDREHVDKAFLVRRRERRDFPLVRLVNTRKIDDARREAEPGTLASVIEASDPVAGAFVLRRVGNVRLAETQADLHKPGRAVMRDGTYDDGLVVETREVRDRMIGGRANEIMRTLVEKELASALQDAAALDGDKRLLGSMLQRVDEARLELLGEERPTALRNRIDVIQRQLGEIEEALQGLGKLVDPAMTAKLGEIDLQLRNAREERDTQIGERRTQADTVKRLAREIEAGEANEGSRLHAIAHRARYARRRREVPYSAGRKLYGAALAEHRSHRTVYNASRAAEAGAEERRIRAEGQVRDGLAAFFQEFGERSLFTHESRVEAEIRPWLIAEIAFIEDNELTRYERQAREAADRASLMFRNSFVNDLRERFERVDREIRQINEGLRNFPLHNERYSFHKSVNESYRAIERIVAMSKAEDEAWMPLFRAGVPEDHPHREAIETVERLLLDPGFDFAPFEDYRNFFAFDLWMEDVTTGRKTRWDVRRLSGSGAEQQVPFYVAIGAALASIYHGRSRPGPDQRRGIALAVFDEAFSKMDPRNQRQMLAFYASLGLQTVIAAPFENRSVFYEAMSAVVEVYRHGDQAETEVQLIKDRTRREMEAINPDRLSPDRLRDLAAD